MARTSNDPLEGMKLEMIPGPVDDEGTVRAGVKVIKGPATELGARLEGGLQANIWFRVDEKGLRFGYFELYGDDIRSEDIRLPLTAIKKWVVDQIGKRKEVVSLGALIGEERHLAAAERAFDRINAEPGQTVRNDQHWAYIAELYLEGCRIFPNEPIIYMKQKLEEKEKFWSRSQVASEKEQAKQRGWLQSKGTPGKAGADPGPKLIEYRKQQQEDDQ